MHSTIDTGQQNFGLGDVTNCVAFINVNINSKLNNAHQSMDYSGWEDLEQGWVFVIPYGPECLYLEHCNLDECLAIVQFFLN